MSKKLVNRVLKETTKNEREIKKFLNKIIGNEVKKMDIVDARGTVRVGDYVFEYEVRGRKVQRVRML